MPKNALNITREKNFSEWYQEVISRAELADNSVVRGCMVIRPYGYSIWENIRNTLDKQIKNLGVQNAYFPLLIPLEFLEKEAEHIDGFAKECAVVTHHRLKQTDKGLEPDGKLEKPYIIRPTSETIIGESFSNWINSYRDLPMKINQWANVVRWEMRPRLFLRTSEFLWQEGHNVFATQEEAKEDAQKMLNVYKDLMENLLAISGIPGQKTEDEKFPGADSTYTIESMMQDGKALQSCTSHDLGQHFTKASNIKFTDADTKEQFAYSNSWGITTRLIGSLIMSHSDDDGLVLPPYVAPYKVVIIPVIHDESQKSDILKYCQDIKNRIGDNVYIDDSYKKTPDKKWDWVRKGAPIIMEIGKRELEEEKVYYMIRYLGQDGKKSESLNEFVSNYKDLLKSIHNKMLEKNKKHLEQSIKTAETLMEIENIFKKQTCFISIPAKFWNNKHLEDIMEKYKVSYRCYPFDDKERLIIAKSY